MRALVYELAGAVGVGAVDVAGRPLLVRQLQFLRDLGIQDVVVEVSEGPQALERAVLLLGSDPLTAKAIVIPSAAPMGLEELARRAGLQQEEAFLALPANLVLHAQLELSQAPRRFLLASPLGNHEAGVVVDLRTLAEPASEVPERVEGWGMCVATHDHAHALACAALEGRAPGLMLHAAEVKPGIWFARGARVAPDAQLHAPVLIGVEARVYARAQVGPRALVGAASVIEREAVIADSSIAAHIIVGEGTRIGHAHADAHGMVSFADGSLIPVDDPLILASRTTRSTAFSSRLLALLAVLVLAVPWLLAALLMRASGRRSVRAIPTRRGSLHVGELGIGFIDLLPALFDVIVGRRDLVGIGDRRAVELACARDGDSLRPAALDVSGALAPNASTATLIRMWRWYRVHKNGSLDRSLWRERGPGLAKK